MELELSHNQSSISSSNFSPQRQTKRSNFPTFHLISIDITSMKLNLRVLDAELMLTVHVTNPNIAAIHYSSTTISFLYAGTVLGTAEVMAGSQPDRSCQLIMLPKRLDGMEFAQHARRFFADVAKREIKLEAKLDIEGAAKVLWCDHIFKVHVDSVVTVDPVFLDVIGQENRSLMDLLLA